MLLLFSSLGGGIAYSQAAAEAPAAEKPVPLTPEELAAKAVKEAKAAAKLKKLQDEALAELLVGATELTAEQRANFEKWIPHTFKRLQKRAPVHIAAIGDSVTRYMSYDDLRENSHYAYHGVFAERLASEFFYTGGVRDINPKKPEWSKRRAVIGDEITLENLGMNGRVSLHALSRITADGLVNQPDLVLINFGINDVMLGLGLPTYIAAIEKSVRYVKSTGADVILLGPSSMARQGTVTELAMTRPYSGAMREIAARQGVFFFDLSAVTMAGPGTTAATGEQALASIASNYKRSYFDHDGDNNDGLHPNPKTHAVMGGEVFKALRDGVKEEPYRIKGFVALGADGAAVVEFKMKNLQETAAKGHLLLMPVGGMAPTAESIPFELAAGKAQVFQVNYQARGAFSFPADAARVFVPMIVTDSARTYSTVFGAPVTPVGVVWKTGSTDLTSSSFTVKCDLVAMGQTASSGTYEATWKGQKASGKFAVQAGARDSLALSFKVPSAGSEFSVRDQLVLSLNTGGKVLKFDRTLEASRNIGVGETVSMMNPTSYLKGEKSPQGRVNFSAQASAKNLVLNFDADNIPLEGNAQLPPLRLDFQIDARAFGKRRKFGYVDLIRVRFNKSGVAEQVSAFRPSAFGDWYSRALDNTHLGAKRTLLANGRARYSITIPRSYLYHHEFALGKTNSTFGINAELSFARTADPADPYPAALNFGLVKSGLNKHAAQSLTVLELAQKSSGRWSIRLN